MAKIVFFTAGAAGMYCGSCIHDNVLAKALARAGHDCILQPLYTPIRTDSTSVARKQLFFGGIHIYLLDKAPWMSKLPRFVRRPLDFPPLVRWMTRRASAVDAAALGELTISMLRGTAGRQADEADRMLDWLADESPDHIIWSNLLITGTADAIRDRLPATEQIVLLQGDDIFLDHLTPRHRDAVVTLMRSKLGSVDRMVVNSDFYARRMGEILDVAAEKFEVHPLSIESGFRESALEADPANPFDPQRFDIGYMARIAPEKGLHVLVEAFIELAPRVVTSHLHVAGYMGADKLPYFNEQIEKIAAAGLLDRFIHHGEVTLEQKRALLARMDVVSVPTTYAEPKGLFVLESLDAGTPVVQPDHGGFGELIASTGGGLLFPPGDVHALADQLQRLHDEPERRAALGEAGQTAVRNDHTTDAAAARLVH